MRTFWNFNGGIKHIDAWEPNCWVQVTCPVDDDREFLEQELGMPDYFMDDVSDADERARYDMDEGWLMIILRVPHLKSVSSRSPYTTIPLGIVVKGDKIITICNQETRMMLDFVNHQMRRAEGFTDAADLVFRLFLSTSVWYLKYLKQVNGIIEKAKRDLDKHIDNKDLVNLSRLQDSLTYFGTSIRGNESLLSKLKFRLPVDELDAELIEDVNIEMNQAIADVAEHDHPFPDIHHVNVRHEPHQWDGKLEDGLPNCHHCMCGQHSGVVVVVQKEKMAVTFLQIATWVYQFILAYTHFRFF